MDFLESKKDGEKKKRRKVEEDNFSLLVHFVFDKLNKGTLEDTDVHIADHIFKDALSEYPKSCLVSQILYNAVPPSLCNKSIICTHR